MVTGACVTERDSQQIVGHPGKTEQLKTDEK